MPGLQPSENISTMVKMTMLCIAFIFAGMKSEDSMRYEFLILEDSQLYIKGSSNVTDFTCLCLQDFGSHTFTFRKNEQRNTIHFTNTTLEIETRKLDCQHKGINRDMYKTLRAEQYPYIDIQLVKAFPPPNLFQSGSNSFEKIRVNVVITIAGVSKSLIMQTKSKKLNDNKYRFVAEQILSMQDFCLEPPAPLFGLVRVDDQITIHMDLMIQVHND